MGVLSAEDFLIRQNGGTWSELFDRASLINSHEWITVLLWLAAFWALGMLFFPLTNLVFGKLKDGGYAVSKLFGLLLTGYAVWLGAFKGFAYSRAYIAMILGAFAGVNLIILILRKKTIFAISRRTMITSDLVFLGCFLFFLAIRYGNPDLWHPYKGGERPMDFSYFNAILKSTSFPPYDPWFAGGYLNYYYYGIFLSGVMVKLLGVVPSVAFNLNLATWYAFLGSAAFILGRFLYEKMTGKKGIRAGLATLIGMQLLGNLGTVVQIKNELVELGENSNALLSFFSGLGKLFHGETLRMYKGDWYWIPSRAIPDTSITEFPFFTFLYGDPHAHLFALPITVLVILWLAVMVYRLSKQEKTRPFDELFSLFAGGLIIGTLIPTNTWDMPTYLCLACAVLLYAAAKYGIFGKQEASSKQKLLFGFFAVLIVAAVCFALFIPYFQTNSRENVLKYWDETHTPVSSYLMHWGLFLFMIASWYAVLTWDWMAKTPLRLWREFRKQYQGLIWAGIILALILFIGLQKIGVVIGWLALPMMIWSLALLILRKDAHPLERLVCFMVGAALFASLLVEVIHLADDYGRMNTVFKFYNQIWIMLSISAGLSFACVLNRLETVSHERIVHGWQINAALLIFGAFLYPIFAGTDKITDRMSAEAPHTLDGMTYMKTSSYWQDGIQMDLSQDYEAIRWMQENIKGSPVIVEANATEYKFGSRYTMYTGLPGVVGWNYHQRQQRGSMSEQVWQRVNEIGAFYETAETEAAVDFLEKYHVRYIILGQMERGMYSDEGIMKFDNNDGILWNCVYENEDTQIFEVL